MGLLDTFLLYDKTEVYGARPSDENSVSRFRQGESGSFCLDSGNHIKEADNGPSICSPAYIQSPSLISPSLSSIGTAGCYLGLTGGGFILYFKVL